jgi:hypothetical protein
MNGDLAAGSRDCPAQGSGQTKLLANCERATMILSYTIYRQSKTQSNIDVNSIMVY